VNVSECDLAKVEDITAKSWTALPSAGMDGEVLYGYLSGKLSESGFAESNKQIK